MPFTTFPINTQTATAALIANVPAGSVTATNVQDAINQLDTAIGGPHVFLSDFGVVGDGATDDTTALNAVFAGLVGTGATVVWDVGFCKVTNTIVVGQIAAGPQSHINILCPNGPITSGIKWNGPTTDAAVNFARQKFTRTIGLGIYNQVAKGTTIGLAIGGAGGGNQSSGLIFDGLFVDGFAVGAQAGFNGSAASEMTFNLPVFQNCDFGFQATDFNSLDFTFNCPAFAACGIGIDSSASSGFAVFGGSASESTVADFKIQANSTQTYIGGGFRSELAELFLLGATSTGGDVVVEKVLVTDPQHASDRSISGNFAHLVVRDSALAGSIYPRYSNSVEVIGCRLTIVDTTRKLPVIMDTTTFEGARTRCFFRNNSNCIDHQGIIGLEDMPTTVPFNEPCITIVPMDDTTVAGFGTEYLALSHVRSLSEGGIGGSTAGTAPVPGKNLRVQATLAAGTKAFTFIRSLTGGAGGTRLVTSTVGTFFPSDVGKRMTITNGSDTGTNWHGYITQYLSPTTVNVHAGSIVGATTPGNRYPSGAAKTITVGEDEPDANYLVAGIVGSAAESFGVSAIATTGFTITSSNGASTATVTALIVR